MSGGTVSLGNLESPTGGRGSINRLLSFCGQSIQPKPGTAAEEIAKLLAETAKPRLTVKWKASTRIVGGQKAFFRSGWEHKFCLYLQLLKEQGKIKDWRHEPETFWFQAIKRGTRSYLPDFRVTENDLTTVYYEVKGWMDAKSKTKLKRMSKYHPHIKIVLIDKTWFKDNAKKLSWLPGWND